VAGASVLTPRFTDAVEYARALFAHDTRKDGVTPYLSHLLAVAAIVLEHGGSEDAAIAGLLHDAAEDHGGAARLDDIAARFGTAVATTVATCSDSLEPEGHAKRPWWERKVAYIDRLARADADAAIVAAADKLHNARTTRADYRVRGPAVWSQFNADAGRAGTLWYYRRIVEVLPPRLGDSAQSLGAELARVVAALVDDVRTTEADDATLTAEFDAALAREHATRRIG
jgi:(p)ppGpp synthase/HD superfamily hydrolase